MRLIGDVLLEDRNRPWSISRNWREEDLMRVADYSAS
jgi:hypothetical protein